MNKCSVSYILYDWGKDSQNKLAIMIVPEPIKVAPPEVLNSIKCGCKNREVATGGVLQENVLLEI